jgi:transcriptional regulator with XRE-family HTH domain
MNDYYVPIGERIAFYRRRRGLSQLRLSLLIGRSENWVSKVERGELPLDRLSVLMKVAEALHINLGDLLRDLQPLGDDAGAVNADPPAVRALRRYLAGLSGRSGTPRSLAALVSDLGTATRLRSEGRYSDLGAVLPDLLADLEVSARDEPAALPVLARAYCEGEVLASSRGVHDLAWLAADRAVQTAQRVEDPALFAESVFWLTHAHLGAGRLDDALAVADDGIARVAEHRGDAGVRALSGAIHLPMGIALARHGDEFGAENAFREAATLTRDGDGTVDVPAIVGRRTQFGLANVGLHQMSGAVEQGRSGEALRLAEQVDIHPLPASRQARYWVDVGLAHAQRRATAEMTGAFATAERLSPESVRDIPLVRETVHGSLRRERGPRNTELHDLAQRLSLV